MMIGLTKLRKLTFVSEFCYITVYAAKLGNIMVDIVVVMNTLNSDRTHLNSAHFDCAYFINSCIKLKSTQRTQTSSEYFHVLLLAVYRNCNSK